MGEKSCTNTDTDALKNLQEQTLKAVQGLLMSFNLFREEDSRLDLLLSNLETIMSKYMNESTTIKAQARASSIDFKGQAEESKSTSNSNELATLPANKSICDSKSSFADSGKNGENKPKLNPIATQNKNETDAVKRRREENDTVVQETSVSGPIPHRIFSVELVLRRILRRFPMTELLHCRHIDSNFKHLTDRIIRRRPHTCIKFLYKWDSHNYALETSKEESKNGITDYTLSAFTEFIKKCTKFPNPRFRFDGGTLCSPDLQEFLLVYGKNVIELQLSVFCPPNRIELLSTSPIYTYPTICILKNLLVNQVPNLEILVLEKCPLQWTSDISFHRLFPEPKGKEITLPKLRYLHIPKSFFTSDHILIDLLRAACNLDTVVGEEDLENPLPCVKLNKFHLLRECFFEPDPDDIELFEKALPSLKSGLINLHVSVSEKMLKVPEMFPKFSRILLHILKGSYASKTLFINFYKQIGFLPNFTIPVLPNVRNINIQIKSAQMFEENQLTKKHFPLGFQFSTSFHCNYEWDDYFDYYRPVLTVKFLEFGENKLPLGCFQKFASIFPNIETLLITSAHFNAVEARHSGLWGFAQLKQITLRIDIFDELNDVPTLDSVFTGFSSETCNQLLKPLHNIDLATIDEVREFPSIVDLKNLEELSLEFVDGSEARRSDYPTIFTHVTGLYAFQMCPRLKVTVSCFVSKIENSHVLRNMLSILDDYVDVEFPFKSFKD